MRNISFNISDIFRRQTPRDRSIFQPSAPSSPASAGIKSLSYYNFYDGTGGDAFNWDLDDYGWDQGRWAGHPEKLLMWLSEDLALRVGHGVAAFTRAGTVNRTNEFGGTDTLAANTAPFDWRAGPKASNRYCYRVDSGAKLLVPVSRNFRRSQGAVSFWLLMGANLGIHDSYFFDCGSIQVWLPATSYKIRITATQIDAATKTAEYDYGSIQAGWVNIVCSWSQANNRIRVYTDGVLRATTALTARIAQLDDNAGVGQAEAGGAEIDGYLVDFRSWPLEATQTLVDNLFLVKA